MGKQNIENAHAHESARAWRTIYSSPLTKNKIVEEIKDHSDKVERIGVESLQRQLAGYELAGIALKEARSIQYLYDEKQKIEDISKRAKEDAVLQKRYQDFDTARNNVNIAIEKAENKVKTDKEYVEYLRQKFKEKVEAGKASGMLYTSPNADSSKGTANV